MWCACCTVVRMLGSISSAGRLPLVGFESGCPRGKVDAVIEQARRTVVLPAMRGHQRAAARPPFPSGLCPCHTGG